MRTDLVLLMVLVTMAACHDDPFDPLIGPRNETSGAKRYLDTRPDISLRHKQAVLEWKETDPELLRALADAPVREIRALVAANPNTPADVLIVLSRDPETGVRQYLLHNASLPRSALLKLAEDPNELVRSSVAENPGWSPQELRTLYRQGANEVLIAGNPSAPHDLLLEILKKQKSSSSLALSYMAGNPSISAEIMDLLATHGDESVKLNLLGNPMLTQETLLRLTNDPNPRVRSNAEQIAWRREEGGPRPEPSRAPSAQERAR